MRAALRETRAWEHGAVEVRNAKKPGCAQAAAISAANRGVCSSPVGPKRGVRGGGMSTLGYLAFCRTRPPYLIAARRQNGWRKNLCNFCEGPLSSVSPSAGCDVYGISGSYHDHANAGIRPRTHKSKLISSGWSMSALPPRADIRQRVEHVCFVPKADGCFYEERVGADWLVRCPFDALVSVRPSFGLFCP